MKHIFPWITVALIIVLGSAFQPIKPQPQDPVITLRLTLPQVSAVVYSLRNSTILDAKSANELADRIVAQANDTTVNKFYKPGLKQTPRH